MQCEKDFTAAGVVNHRNSSDRRLDMTWQKPNKIIPAKVCGTVPAKQTADIIHTIRHDRYPINVNLFSAILRTLNGETKV